MVYGTRGLYLLAGQAGLLWLKHRSGAGLPPSLFWGLVSLAVAAQLFRTWAAGLVGTTARGRALGGASLLTAGPYAHVRNPMYLGNLVIASALALMSGLWYALGVAWAAYREAVPRLLPAWRGYPVRQGVFRLAGVSPLRR